MVIDVCDLIPSKAKFFVSVVMSRFSIRFSILQVGHLISFLGGRGGLKMDGKRRVVVHLRPA